MALTAERGTATMARDFDAFYRDHRDPIYRALTLTFGDIGLAAEAVDEAMTRALERWPDVSGYANAPGWVYRVGYNWGISRLRRSARETALLPTGGVWHDPEPRDASVLAAIGDLDLDRRAVVVLRYYLDWSTDEVADALEIPTGTVKSRLHRALAELSERLEAGP